jgi:hypothetical protein
MKTISHLSLLCCLFAFARTQAVGMGYPQDMFADHMTAKTAAPVAKAAVSLKKEKCKVVTNTCESLAQARATSPCIQLRAQPAKPETNTRKAAKAEPLIFPVQQLNVIVLKVFHLDGKVEDQVVPKEECTTQSQVSCTFKKLIQTLGQPLPSYL